MFAGARADASEALDGAARARDGVRALRGVLSRMLREGIGRAGEPRNASVDDEQFAKWGTMTPTVAEAREMLRELEKVG